MTREIEKVECTEAVEDGTATRRIPVATPKRSPLHRRYAPAPPRFSLFDASGQTSASVAGLIATEAAASLPNTPAMLRRASRRTSDASINPERVGAGWKDLVAFAVTPSVPRRAVIAQECQQVSDRLHALRRVLCGDARVRIAAGLGAVRRRVERLLPHRLRAQKFSPRLRQRFPSAAHMPLDSTGQMPRHCRRIELRINWRPRKLERDRFGQRYPKRGPRSSLRDRESAVSA